MPFAYVTQPGATVRKVGRKLVVENDGETIASFGLTHLQALIIRSGVTLTTPAIRALLYNNVDAAFLSKRGAVLGHLISPRGGNAGLRLAQYRLQFDREERLRLAQCTVADKIDAMQDVLTRYASNYADPAITAARKSLEEAARSVMAAGLLEQLLGIEGNAAAAYWSGFRKLNRSALGFYGRTRRPPRDEVNALLSLGYVLLTNELRALVENLGFDPYLGYYHKIKPNRPSLALDVVEPFRHLIVDRLVLRLANLTRLKKSHFEGDEGAGYRLSTTGWKIFLTEYEERMLAAPSGAMRDEYPQARTWREVLQKRGLKLRRTLERKPEADQPTGQLEDS